MFGKLRSGLGAALLLTMSMTAAGAQTGGDTINIGFTGPLSGGAAAYGGDTQRGLQMAIDEINDGGGITVAGKKMHFKLVSLDDQYRPPEAATNAKRLVQESGTPIVFCPHSGGILAIQGFNEKQSPKFILGAYSSEPAILRQNNGLTVMIPPAYDEYFKPYIANLMPRFGKKLGLLATTTAYGDAWAKSFSAAWTAAGGTVLANSGVDYNTTADFSGAVTKALSEKPDVLLVGGPSQPTGLVIKAARAQGFKGGFAMMDQAKFDQVLTVVPLSDLEGVMGVNPFKSFTGPGLATFLAAYEKKYGALKRDANSELAFNYEAMHLFAEAIKLANSTDPVAIMAKVHAAGAGLPAKYQPGALSGMTKAGHLKIQGDAAIVDKGKFRKVALPFTE